MDQHMSGVHPSNYEGSFEAYVWNSLRRLSVDGRPYENFPIRHKLNGATRELIFSVSKNVVGLPLNWEDGFTLDWNSTRVDDRGNKSAKDFLLCTPPAVLPWLRRSVDLTTRNRIVRDYNRLKKKKKRNKAEKEGKLRRNN